MAMTNDASGNASTGLEATRQAEFIDRQIERIIVINLFLLNRLARLPIERNILGGRRKNKSYADKSHEEMDRVTLIKHFSAL